MKGLAAILTEKMLRLQRILVTAAIAVLVVATIGFTIISFAPRQTELKMTIVDREKISFFTLRAVSYGVKVTNLGSRALTAINITTVPEAHVSDQTFSLLPGESRVLNVVVTGSDLDFVGAVSKEGVTARLGSGDIEVMVATLNKGGRYRP